MQILFKNFKSSNFIELFVIYKRKILNLKASTLVLKFVYFLLAWILDKFENLNSVT